MIQRTSLDHALHCPPELLEQPYTGCNEQLLQMQIGDWWVRFFDYL